jgi:hypothetical protein
LFSKLPISAIPHSSTAFCNCICKFSNFKFVFFEGDEGEAEANPTLLLDDRDDAFLKHNANLPVSTNYHNKANPQ